MYFILIVYFPHAEIPAEYWLKTGSRIEASYCLQQKDVSLGKW